MSEHTLKMLAALSLLTTSPLAVLSNSAFANDAADAPETIDVSAPRLKAADTGQAVTRLTFDAETPTLRLDSLLTSMPGVGLFRRANSLTAHPTTQGLTMRGVGANGAGRVLVTLDGVPLNDPFGGWVYWSAIDAASLDSVRVLEGGAPGAYGAQALAGAVELTSQRPEKTGGRASLSYGSYESVGLSASADYVAGDGYLSLDAGHFESDGFYLVPKADRGPIDAKASSEVQHVNARAGYALDTDTELTASVRWYREERVNGLSLATNETDAVDASVRLLHAPADGVGYELAAYYRTRDFANVFASARDDRTTELSVLDQYDVPGWGAGFLARVQHHGIELGVDARRMSGETNEYFRNLGGGFTRERKAGGDQWTIGLYTEATHEADWGALSATVRADRWRTYGGVRQEFDLADGSLLRDDAIENKGDWEFSGRLGARADLTGAIAMRAAAYKSWRLPTINEYYRPFRVVNDITEANPDLVPEKLYGLEVGFDYRPLNSLHLGVTLFRNWLTDAVGNVTIGYGPGFFPLGGFVPGGGVLRQRTNIDRSVTDGLELTAEATLNGGWSLVGRYLYARARITKFDAMPDLVGNRPVQTPRHSLFAGVRYDAGGPMRLDAEARYASAQYDDDVNTRLLDDIVTVNASAAYDATDWLTLTLAAENLFDAKVVSAVTEDGLETLAQRRFIRAGASVRF